MIHFTCNIWGPSRPRVSILGPCIFLAYINDLPNSVKSKVRLFADDTIVYFAVKTSTDANILQNDLHALEKNGSRTGPWNLIPTSVKY